MTAAATKMLLKIKSVFMLLQSLLHLSHLVDFIKCCSIFWELNSKGQYISKFRKRKRGSSCVQDFSHRSRATNGKLMYKRG